MPLLQVVLLLGAGCRFDPRGVAVNRDAAVLDRAAETLQFPDHPPPDHGRDLTFLPLPDATGDIGCPTMFKCKDGKTSQLCLGGGTYGADRPCFKACDGATGLCTFSSSNPDVNKLVPLGHGKLEVADGQTVEVDTTTCTVKPPLPAGSFTAAPGLHCILVTGEVSIRPKGTLRALGGRPLILAASGPVKIDGLIDASADGNLPGPGGGPGGKHGIKPPSGAEGQGFGCGGGVGSSYDFGDGTRGGAGGTFGGAGGAGGGIGSSPGPSAKKPAACAADCQAPVGGSGGGLGAGAFSVAAAGGGGGGGLQITSMHSIEIPSGGRIDAGGGGGRALGSLDHVGVGGAGGGSGGGVILEAWRVKADGWVTANGGGGSSGAPPGADQKPGEDGLRDGSTAPGGGSTKWGLGVGGAGGAGSGDTEPASGGSSVAWPHFAGGGGGGGGRICVRVSAAEVDTALKGSFSPSQVEPLPDPAAGLLTFKTF